MVLVSSRKFVLSQMSETASRHEAFRQEMLGKSISGLNISASRGANLTALTFQIRSATANRQINEFVKTKLHVLVDELGFVRQSDFERASSTRNIPFLMLAKGLIGKSELEQMGILVKKHLLNSTLHFHIAGLYYSLDPLVGLEFGIKVYLSDRDYSALMRIRRLIRNELKTNSVGNRGVLEEQLFAPRIPLALSTPTKLPFGPLQNHLKTPLYPLCRPEENHIVTLAMSFKEIVLRCGVGRLLGSDPTRDEISF